ncbi:Zinc finger Y-chromosomal protein, partial [Orchesella cincta]
ISNSKKMGDDVEGRSFIRDDIKLEEEEGFVKFECKHLSNFIKTRSDLRTKMVITEMKTILLVFEGAAFVETPVETVLKSDVDVRDEEQSMMGHDVSPDVDADLKLSMKQEDGADEFITGDLDQSDDDKEEEGDEAVNSPPSKRSRLDVNQIKKKSDSSLERKNYNCRSCSFTSEHEARFKNHLKLHKKGSKSIICSECGCHVHPCCMTVHLKSCHATTQDGTKGVMEQDTSNPLFSTHYTGDSKWPILKCRSHVTSIKQHNF